MWSRGHQHRAARPTDVGTGLTVLEADATKLGSLVPRLVGHDAVISEPDLEWAFLSPSADFAPGKQLLNDAKGKGHISMEDFAIAMVDELKQRAHSRQRFTVGY